MTISSLLTCGAVWLLALTSLSPAGSPAGALVQSGKSLAGQLLVATEDLHDPRFTRTVVYLVKHDATGALGLVVNRPLQEVPLAPLLRRLGLDDSGVTGALRLHYGGPVEPTSALLLHTAEYATQGTERVAADVAVTPLIAPPVVLGEIGRGGGPRRYLFALGYAGWAPGQLEGEIDQGSWITVSADEALLFDTDYARKWDRAMARRRTTI